MKITYFLTITLLFLNGINANPRRGSDDLNQEYDDHRTGGLTLLENYTSTNNTNSTWDDNTNSTSRRHKHKHRHGGRFRNRTRDD